MTAIHTADLKATYDLATQLAHDLLDSDDGVRPPTVPEHLRDEALAAGYVMIAAELLDSASQRDPGGELVIFPASYMDALCRVMVLISADSYGPEVDDALNALVDAQEQYSESPGNAAHVHDLDQADAHFDRLSWEALVRHNLAPYPSFMLAYLTTEDPGCAARMCS